LSSKHLHHASKEMKKIRTWLEKLDLGDSTLEQIHSLLQERKGDVEQILKRMRGEGQEQRALLADERELLQKICDALHTGTSLIGDIRDELNDLIGETVEITVNFGLVTGTVRAVRIDYVVLEDSLGRFVYLPFTNIQAVALLD
jgi:DNA-binding transcriptional MerR regulator